MSPGTDDDGATRPGAGPGTGRPGRRSPAPAASSARPYPGRCSARRGGRGAGGARGPTATNLDGLDVERSQVDVRDAERGGPAPWRRAACFHVAALYRFWAARPAEFYDVNVGGTPHVLDAARGRRRAHGLHEHGRHHRPGRRRPAGRRTRRLRPRRPPLRALQAVEVRGRARGAPGRGPGRCR